MKRRQRSHRYTRKAVALIWVAVTGILLIGFVGLAMDTSLIYRVSQQLQTASDASALAGARLVRVDQDAARQAAIDIAFLNTAGIDPVQLEFNGDNAPDGDIVLGRYNRDERIFTPDTEAPNAVRVFGRRTGTSPNGPQPLVFATAFGVTLSNIERDAIAMIGGATGAGLIVLNTTQPCTLEVPGNSTVRVVPAPPLECPDGGAIQVNSSHVNAACTQGNAHLIATEMNVVGGHRHRGNSPNLDDPCNPGTDFPINTGASPLPDPLAWLQAPTWDPADDLGVVSMSGGNETITLQPGYYSGGISANGGNLTLEPGIYILDGTGLQIGGNVTACAKGVLFYIIGTGVIDIDGTGAIEVTGINLDDTEFCDPSFDYPAPISSLTEYEGISIFQARDNHNPARIIGTGLLDLNDTLYFPENHVRVGGTGDGFGSQLIADTLEVFGNADVSLAYDGRFPSIGDRVFLVK